MLHALLQWGSQCFEHAWLSVFGSLCDVPIFIGNVELNRNVSK
jgi:hypothetical protein